MLLNLPVPYSKIYIISFCRCRLNAGAPSQVKTLIDTILGTYYKHQGQIGKKKTHTQTLDIDICCLCHQNHKTHGHLIRYCLKQEDRYLSLQFSNLLFKKNVHLAGSLCMHQNSNNYQRW